MGRPIERLVRIYKQKASRFWWGQFILPPNVRRHLDVSKFPIELNLRPDRRNRVSFSLKTAHKPEADRRARTIEYMIEKAGLKALNRDVFNVLTNDKGETLKTIEDFFTELSVRDKSLVEIANSSVNPIEARKAGGLQPPTAGRYELHRRHFYEFLRETHPGRGFLVSEIDVSMLKLFNEWMRSRYQVGTRRHCRNYLSSVWSLAIASGYCDKNPWQSKELRIPKNPKRDWPTLTLEQRQLLLSQEPSPMANALIVMILTAARPSDLAWLQRTDINWSKQEVSLLQSKTGDRKPFPLYNELRTVLRRQLASHSSPFVFPRPDGGRNTRQYLDKRLNHALQKILGQQISCYALRRTAITLMLEAGIDPELISQMAGHQDRSMIAIYAQHRAEARFKAAEKLDAAVRGNGVAAA